MTTTECNCLVDCACGIDADAPLMIDPDRVSSRQCTGIYVRARSITGRWRSADIAHLDSRSLLAFLRSRGGGNAWAEDVVGLVLGHGPLHAA